MAEYMAVLEAPMVTTGMQPTNHIRLSTAKSPTRVTARTTGDSRLRIPLILL